MSDMFAGMFLLSDEHQPRKAVATAKPAGKRKPAAKPAGKSAAAKAGGKTVVKPGSKTAARPSLLKREADEGCLLPRLTTRRGSQVSQV